jgi:hypothetical protein
MRIADWRGQFVRQVNYDYPTNSIAISVLSAPKLCKGKRIKSSNEFIDMFASFK